jgi:VWFA-related protein
MHSRRVVRGALAVFAVVLASGSSSAPVRGQEPAQAAPELILPTGVEVVRLDVVVTEKRGRPRAGLRREDFAVFEDGHPQEIVQFHAFARPAATHPVPAGEASKPGSGATSKADEGEAGLENLLPARYVVLAIDDVHMEFESLSRARKALSRFLNEDLRPEDQVALVTTSGASALSQEFTSDRAVLQQVLNRLSPQGRIVDWTSVPRLTDYQAEMIETGDPLALEAAVQEIMQVGIFQDREMATEEARRRARVVLAEAVSGSRLTLEALESLCRGLAGLSGRKAVFLVSDGFLTGLSMRSDTSFDIHRIADAATRAGVAVYALDTRGLVGSPPAARAASPSRILLSSFGAVEAMRQRSLEATRDAMNALAANTGGFLVESANNLQAGLRELLGDTETYYVLAYEPTNRERDGGFRKVEVRVPGVSGVKVRTRSGYYAPGDPRRRLVEANAEAAARRAEQRRAEMNVALGALAPLRAIPVQLDAAFVSLDGAASHVVVSGSVDVATLPFVRVENRRQATMEIAALVYDEEGHIVARPDAQRSEMNLSEDEHRRLLKEGLPYRRTVALGPGRYQVRLAVREDTTGLLGSAFQKVEVPDLQPERLALSGLFLLKDDGAGPPAESPPAAGVLTESQPAAGPPAQGSGRDPVLRSVQDRPRYLRDERLYVQLFAYNPKRDAGGIDLVAQAEVLRQGVVLATAAAQPLVDAEPRAPVPHLSGIRLQPFAAGNYELRVTVTDRKAGAMVTRSAAFSVE